MLSNNCVIQGGGESTQYNNDSYIRKLSFNLKISLFTQNLKKPKKNSNNASVFLRMKEMESVLLL